MIDGNPINSSLLNENQIGAMETFTDFIIAEKFGWTPEQIARVPRRTYSDFLTLISLINARQKAEMEKAKRNG